MTRITLSRRAAKALRAMNDVQADQARAAFKQFRADPRHPGLNFERLRGRDNLYSIRVTHSDRAVLRRFLDAEGELFEILLVGPHDIYRLVARL